MFLVGGVVLFTLGGWTLYVAISRAVVVADVDLLAILIGSVALLIGVWLAWIGFRSRKQPHAEPILVQASGESHPTPNVSTATPTRRARPTRSRLEKWLDKWGMLVYAGIVVLLLATGSGPKDEHGRPKILRGRFFWREDPSPVGKPVNPLLDKMRGAREASKRNNPPIAATEAKTNQATPTSGELTEKFWRDTVVRLPETLQSKQSTELPSFLHDFDLSLIRSKFDDRDHVDRELVDLAARALVNVEDYLNAANEEPLHEPSSGNNNKRPQSSVSPQGTTIFPDLPALDPEQIEWWRAARKLARSEESRITESLLASLDNYDCPPLAGVTASGEEQQKSLERLRINFYQIEQLREKLEERYPDQQFTLPWESLSQDSG